MDGEMLDRIPHESTLCACPEEIIRAEAAVRATLCLPGEAAYFQQTDALIAYKNLTGFSRQKLIDMFGVTKYWVDQRLAFRALSPLLRKKLRGVDGQGLLPYHISILASFTPELQDEVYEDVLLYPLERRGQRILTLKKLFDRRMSDINPTLVVQRMVDIATSVRSEDSKSPLSRLFGTLRMEVKGQASKLNAKEGDAFAEMLGQETPSSVREMITDIRRTIQELQALQERLEQGYARKFPAAFCTR